MSIWAASIIWLRSFSGIFSLSKNLESDRVIGYIPQNLLILLFNLTLSILLTTPSLDLHFVENHCPPLENYYPHGQ